MTILSLFPMVQMTAHAEDFWAVRPNVHFPNGSPITSTWIELIGPDGKTELREMIGATARLCDFGFGPRTLRVGTNECLSAAISNLQVVIGSPLSLDVTVNGCGYRETMRNACLLYVRTFDDNGNPVSDAKIGPLAVNTDSYGR